MEGARRYELFRTRRENSWINGLNGYPILRQPKPQSGICFHHHVARCIDYRRKIAQAKGHQQPGDFDVLTPPHNEGPFQGKPFPDRPYMPTLVLEAAIALGLPTTKPGIRFHLKEHNYGQVVSVPVLLEELNENGPFIACFMPSIGFPPPSGDIYRGCWWRPGMIGHAVTVVGSGYDLVFEVDDQGNHYMRVDDPFWIIENSWEENERHHRILQSLVTHTCICEI